MVSGTPVSVSAVGSGNASGSTRRKGEGSSLAADSGSKAGVFNRVASKKVHGSSNDRQRSTMAGHVSSSPPAYAFITHSQEGLRNNMPPMIDNAELARRRRRRTSQHDQAILEEEYRKCDRPDKARRREIAAMVEMGDKEVQVRVFFFFFLFFSFLLPPQRVVNLKAGEPYIKTDYVIGCTFCSENFASPSWAQRLGCVRPLGEGQV